MCVDVTKQTKEKRKKQRQKEKEKEREERREKREKEEVEMEFPDVGKHCQVKECSQLDYLYFKCTGCNMILWFYPLPPSPLLWSALPGL